MTTEQMRTAIGEVYSSDSWSAKVKKMPDDQVVAIYYKFLASGKFEKKSGSISQLEEKLSSVNITNSAVNMGKRITSGSSDSRKYEQVSVFELM